MTDRGERAYRNFLRGYNCAQSVAMAFADLTPLDREAVRKAAHAFGGGFGRTRNMCGALAACGMILGLVQPDGKDIQEDKALLYERVQEIYARFLQKFGTTNCAELLKEVEGVSVGGAPAERTAEYYASRPCAQYVRQAAEMLEGYLTELGVIRAE